MSWAKLRPVLPWLQPQKPAGPSRLSLAEREVNKLVNFEDCPNLLRATGRNNILACSGSILGSNRGCDDTFALSDPVTRIDFFLSHNWCVPRFFKFITLTFYFYVGHALTAAMLSCVLIGGLYVSDMLPIEKTREPAWCRIICLPVFFVTLITCNDVQMLLGAKGPHMFLDKTCIHQTDEELKRRGIEKLGAFLHNSDRMLILYSDIYIRKLWTVYELAVFLMLGDVQHLSVVPVHMPLAFVASFSFMYVIQIVIIFSFPTARFTRINDLLIVQLMRLLFCGWIYKVNKDADRIVENINNFSVANCLCFDENDRPIVEKNIAHLAFSNGIVNKGDDKKALEAFDMYVRDNFGDALRSSLRKYASAAKQTILLSLLFFIPEFVDLYVPKNSMAWHRKMMVCLCYVTRCFVLFPFSMYLFDKFSSYYRLRFRGFLADVAWFLISFPVISVPFAVLTYYYTAAMVPRNKKHQSYEIWIILAHVLAAALVVVAVQAQRRCKRKREPIVRQDMEKE
eukprot:TRINITY_DN24287_c0_g3_i1.p1 TRINITY_DN24287_c0_g3~~TRINITY_DN24287_c0_g3_i1.p1  ORF type:complete len:511 (-),score=49.07 TRINITY_DN24287_c0_g3_i1:108-1640(-)